MISMILLYVVAGHNIAYWLYRAWKVGAPILRILIAVRRRPQVPGAAAPATIIGISEEFAAGFASTVAAAERAAFARTDLSKFTTDSAHQLQQTPATPPVPPVDSASGAPHGSAPLG